MFGTAGLNFNVDPLVGIVDALQNAEDFDEVQLNRILTQSTARLSILAAPAALDREHEITEDVIGMVIEVARQQVPFVAVDLPHCRNAWVKSVLQTVDEIVITTTLGLDGLRNTKNIIEFLKTTRPNDSPPHLVINMANTPKRGEIPSQDFCQPLDLKASAVIELDTKNFSVAANNGQMLAEVSTSAKAVTTFNTLAEACTHLAPRLEKTNAQPPQQKLQHFFQQLHKRRSLCIVLLACLLWLLVL